jgi:hypothetical protein
MNAESEYQDITPADVDSCVTGAVGGETLDRVIASDLASDSRAASSGKIGIKVR